ncbi:hypothetical protein [Pseudonocardia sp.]|uniref:FHA domain-containing protein n=1 Tax=Pseudonocardia sp. TaxID=60912 RepID=UPI003D1442ED
MGTPNPGTRVDAARAVVLPGDGAAIRLPGLLCLLRPSTADAPSPGLGHLARLVEILTENSAAHPTSPGRPLARRLGRWLGSLDPGPDFGTIAATEAGIAIFLHGGVDAVVGGQRHSARDSGAWLDRLLEYPAGPLVLLPSDEPTPDNSPRGVFDLRGGVVPAGTVLLVPRSGTLPSVLATPAVGGCADGRGAAEPAAAEPAVVAEPAAAEPAAEPAVATANAAEPAAAAGAVEVDVPAVAGVPAPVAAGGGPATAMAVASTPPAPLPAVGRTLAVPPPMPSGEPVALPEPASATTGLAGPVTSAGRRHARISPILGVGPDEPPRAPLDTGAPPHTPWPTSGDGAPESLPDGADGVPMAAGFRCARDHLNDPRNHFCVVCGIRMNERTGVVEIGPRPPLGVLVFDDGSTYTLDADYLLGRMPESDPRVVGGELRALPVEDPQAQLSRGHLVIKLDGWDVTAIDESTNGTLVAYATDRAWSRLTPRTPLRLLPGTRVRVGGRSFVFESPSGVR